MKTSTSTAPMPPPRGGFLVSFSAHFNIIIIPLFDRADYANKNKHLQILPISHNIHYVNYCVLTRTRARVCHYVKPSSW